ncbi:hypothetical protein Tco_0995743 [Tanacetum coccineum]
MGMDTIQLENAVSTISQVYLLEFTSECGIPEGLHPELPGPEDTIMDFLEGKQMTEEKHSTVLYKTPGLLKKLEQLIFLGGQESISHRRRLACKRSKGWNANNGFLFCGGNDQMDLFNLISAPNPTKVNTGTRPHATHEVPLLTVTASHVIDMEDPVAATESSGTPSTIEKSPMDFANENPSQ